MIRDEKAYIFGAYEHPTRKAPDKSVAQLHAECAAGALADAGLTKDDVDGYFSAGDEPGFRPVSMVDFLNLKVRHCDFTEIGGAAPLQHIAQAACGRQMQRGLGHVGWKASQRTRQFQPDVTQPHLLWERPLRQSLLDIYALCARGHMYEYGTTSEQLAWIKVAASHHAQHNQHAMLRKVVTTQDVLASPMVSDLGASSMKLQGLILGSAGMCAGTGAQAADLPVKAKAIECMKICSLYGAGTWDAPSRRARPLAATHCAFLLYPWNRYVHQARRLSARRRHGGNERRL
ncbi:acetyl-CoA acetyltransferase [Bradyrhizobium sp. LB7.2]